MTKQQFTKRERNEREHFNKVFREYDTHYGYNTPFTRYKVNKKAEEFVRFVKKNYNAENPTIFEIGCGTGEYTKKIAQKLPKAKIIGNDISANMIRLAKDKCKKSKNASFMIESAYRTSLKKESVDIICGFYALHHLDYEMTRKEAFRILKPGGLLFFYEPNLLNPVVYLIKNSKTLRQLAGDSEEEQAINPLSVKSIFIGFSLLRVYTTEFVIPFAKFSFSYLTIIDRISSLLSYIPILNLLGGSVVVCFRKIK